ncbi:thioredoxin domain-containing protein [Allosaccharopolyspora coralli]|uniref:Thioredoxin domain-containing protein n=1 Tax=Allosaccharopolyspora coralli TaxID=2665642 RepID=A0A5Q3Q8T0_9PSEU|nr:thioredoxin domain-containing protein [Allosaccharopolyspora coralli]QGK70783.1 thioredoxin domain-containing protein [Allosaccharopolyspora coralli]
MSKTSNPLAAGRKGPSTNVILTVVVALVGVLVIGGVLLFAGGGGSFGGGQAVPAQTLQRENPNQVLQSEDQKVQVTEFLDYQCPSCAQYYQQVTSPIEDQYQGKIDFTVRNFPLTQAHPLAMPAAQAAEAAGMQGKFKEMYHQIFDNYQQWAVAPGGQSVQQDPARATATFEQYAQQIGLDMAKFRQDRDSDQVSQRIEQDMSDGQQAGVSGTPTIFVNGEKWEPSGGGDPAQQFKERIDQELAK